MKCPKCGSTDVNVQVVSETKLKKKHKPVYWIFVGWWLEPILWLVATVPMLILKLFRPKKYKAKTTHQNMAVCQTCGNSWEIK